MELLGPVPALIQARRKLLEIQISERLPESLVLYLVRFGRIGERLPQGARRPVSRARHIIDALAFRSPHGARAPGPEAGEGAEQQRLAGTGLTHHKHARAGLYQYI